MADPEPTIQVAILGGGIAGLSLAAGLLPLPHLSIKIYESVPEYTDVGAGLALHMNAIKAMDLISPAVKKAYFDRAAVMAEEADVEMSTTVSLAAGRNKGAVVAELGKAKGRKTVARADLLAGLMELVPQGTVVFGRRVEGIQELESGRVSIGFKEGEEVEVDCVIGCDGVHSVIRRYLLGEEHPAAHPVNHDGWQIYRTLVPIEEARRQIDEKFTRSVPILCGPRGHVNCMPLHGGKDVSAGVAVRGARKPGMKADPVLNVASFSDYTEEVQDIIKMVAKDTSASWSVMDHDHAPTYARRHVCIMGDAAHASMPFAGQGAAQAIEDAAVLTRLFSELASDNISEPRRDLIPDLLRSYDEVRRPRSQKVVEIARDFGRLYGFALEGYGDEPEKMKGFFKERAAFTNNADLGRQNDDAAEAFRRMIQDRKDTKEPQRKEATNNPAYREGMAGFEGIARGHESANFGTEIAV